MVMIIFSTVIQHHVYKFQFFKLKYFENVLYNFYSFQGKCHIINLISPALLFIVVSST